MTADPLHRHAALTPHRPAFLRRIVLPLLVASFGHVLLGIVVHADETPATETTGAAAVAIDTQGFLYGTVRTRDETYQGRLRWSDEEAFWGDIFHANKNEQRYADRVPREDRRRRQPIRVLGITIGSTWRDWDASRQLAVRFGDLRSIERRGGDRALLKLKNGTELEVEGNSNDLRATVVIWDRDAGRLEVEWRRIDEITFLPAPADLEVDVYRLHGTVETVDGDFTGYVHWDNQECLSTDELDGDDREGDRHKLAMGDLRAIERRSGSSARVVLKNGDEMILDGTNDVDSSIRGIVVEDPRFGRVDVSWDAFERVTFSDEQASGPGYDTFRESQTLRGTLTTTDGTRHEGQVVFDIDESETWEMLDGDQRDISFHIPFALVKRISPLGTEQSEIELHDGTTLLLGDSADVSEGNNGVLVIGERGDAYVPWENVSRIDLVRADAGEDSQ